MGLFKKKFRNIKKLPNWIYFFPEMFVRCWLLSCRVKVIDPQNLIVNSRSAIVLLWHNRLLFFPVLFPKATRLRTTAMISPSRDGQYIADFAGRFGIKALRGSSSKKGASAQRLAISELEAGNHVVITPDGPRGPKYILSRGPAQLAMLTSRPVIPAVVNASRYWQLKSWDNFQLPKPFCKIELIIGEPIHVPQNLNAEQIEQERLKIQDSLVKITRD